MPIDHDTMRTAEGTMVDAGEWLSRLVDEGHAVAVASVDLSRAPSTVSTMTYPDETSMTWNRLMVAPELYLDGRRQIVDP